MSKVPDSRYTASVCRATPTVSHCLDPGLLEARQALTGPVCFEPLQIFGREERARGNRKHKTERPEETIKTHLEAKLFANQKTQTHSSGPVRRVISGKKVLLPLSICVPRFLRSLW